VIEILWSPRAEADLKEIRAFIDTDSPAWADLTSGGSSLQSNVFESFQIPAARCRSARHQNSAKSWQVSFESSIGESPHSLKSPRCSAGREISLPLVYSERPNNGFAAGSGRRDQEPLRLKPQRYTDVTRRLSADGRWRHA